MNEDRQLLGPLSVSILKERSDMTSRTVCAFCRQEISQTSLTPCCESARRCQERQANRLLK